ncbi:MAG: DUF1667 domain-containing protein [Lachnoclostridium sp.]|nr:DUF1667 domain-containing protein [Lachnoclostridium sp.]
MNRTLTCIICPNGCELEIAYEGDQILSVTGNKCPKGAEYAEQEIKNPMRTIASSVALEGGAMPLVSVRLTGPIPKAKIMDVMAVIRESTVKAPVKIGDVVIADVLGLGVDVVATRNVDEK